MGPPACDQLERRARVSDPEARVWKGSDIPTAEQGVRILGTPLGHPDFVHSYLKNVLNEHVVSPWWRMFNQHGLCCSTAPVDVPITC